MKKPDEPPRGLWQGRIFLAPGLILFLGPAGSASRHVHPAVQIVWGLENDVGVTTDMGSSRSRATVVAANVPHSLDAHGTLVLILVERHSRPGRYLQAQIGWRASRDIAADVAGMPKPSRAMGTPEIACWVSELLHALGFEGSSLALPLSAPVRLALEYLDGFEHTLAGAGERLPRLLDAAKAARVSPSRLTHLFTSDLGLPFRSYLLWWRLKRATLAVRSGSSLTEAAHAALFSDAAHFSRTFRATIGLPPSHVLPFTEFAGTFAG